MEVRLRDERIELLRHIGVPFSMIGRLAVASDLSFADIDWEQTTHDAVTYLVGARPPAHCISQPDRRRIQRRLRASCSSRRHFRSGHSRGRPDADQPLLRRHRAAGQELFDELVGAHPELTAMVTINERATVGVMQAAAMRGWRIPDDLSIISVASSARVAEMTLPPLTALTRRAQSSAPGRRNAHRTARGRNLRTRTAAAAVPSRNSRSTGPSPDPVRPLQLSER